MFAKVQKAHQRLLVSLAALAFNLLGKILDNDPRLCDAAVQHGDILLIKFRKLRS